MAWNFANLSSHHWMLGMFDPRAQEAVWSKDVNALIASSFIFPAGRARKTKGGYTLYGHWPFSSGVESCEWNMLAGVVETDDEADGIEYRIFLLHRNDYKINDTWNATGLCGTGSNDVKVSRCVRCRSHDDCGQRAHRRPDPGQRGQSERAVCDAGVFAVSLRAVGRRSRQCAGLPGRLCGTGAVSRLDL